MVVVVLYYPNTIYCEDAEMLNVYLLKLYMYFNSQK